MTEIPTAGGKLYLATVIDLYSRRLLGAATGLHSDAQLACDAITMAVAARGGADQIAARGGADQMSGVIFHTDSGSTSTATSFTSLCRRLDIRQSMGRVGSCFDINATTEAFFSTLGMGGPVPTHLHPPPPRPSLRPRLVLRLLQPPAATRRSTP